jgi:hypothetical protein
MINNDKNDRQPLFTIVLSVIFVAIYHCLVCHFCRYHCVICHFCRYLPLFYPVIFVVIYHCVVTTKMTDNTIVNNDKIDKQHNGK